MMLEIFRIDRTQASLVRGIIIVIDVIRAFSVASYAFAGGARGLWLVRTIDEALALRQREPQALLTGEVGGRLIPGFDFNNSPARMIQANVNEQLIIQRTGAGTQGAVSASNASFVLVSSFTNAQATATYARQLAQQFDASITILPTATFNKTTPRNEDDICADYIEALLYEQTNATMILKQGLQYLEDSDRFGPWKVGDEDFPREDIAAILAVDRFQFAMVGTAQKWQGVNFVAARRVDLPVE